MKAHALFLGVLLVPLVSCSDSTQFASASAGKIIEAEPITNPTDVPPSADGTAPSPDGTNPDGTNGENPDGTGIVDEGSGGGGTSGPSTNPPVSDPAKMEDSVEQIKLTCSTGVKKQMTKSVRFGEMRGCRWNQNGNLGRREAFLQAVEGQKAVVELPANSQLCEMGIGSAATTIQYDDFMILTLNGNVLLASNQKLLENLNTDADAAYKWDFNRIKGQAVDFNSPHYCLGSDASLCQVPVTDVRGNFAFNIAPESLGKLADNIVDVSRLELALYATGDNDDRDCWHTEFTLDFTFDYVEK